MKEMVISLRKGGSRLSSSEMKIEDSDIESDGQKIASLGASGRNLQAKKASSMASSPLVVR